MLAKNLYELSKAKYMLAKELCKLAQLIFGFVEAKYSFL